MPMWLLVHGILIVFWGSIWFSVYYLRLWTLSTPFTKETSLKIVIFHFLPLSWLSSSFIVGTILYNITRLEKVDIILLLFFPFCSVIFYFINFWFNNSTHQQREEYIQKSIKSFKENCQNWVNQFPFISEENYDLQVFISKDKPVGRMIVYELTNIEESALKEHKEELPSGVTLLFSKKNNYK
jgi:hypothetical protein